jgi:D-alanine-D-alanine ligase
MKNVLVFFGGKSCEHDVSIITGVLTVNSINKELFNAIPIYVDKNGEWYTAEVLKDIEWYKSKNLSKLTKVTLISGNDTLYLVHKNKIKPICKIAVAINCIHGLNGEDGVLAGYLKMCNIPFASPDLFASSLSIDKDFTKVFLSGIGVDKLPCVRLFKDSYYQKKQSTIKMLEKKFSYPVIVKPCNLGSSIGIKIAKTEDELIPAIDKAFTYDDKIIIEKAISNFKEINCAAYKSGDKIVLSECEEPISADEILSFSDKYLGSKSGARKNFPADIPKELSQKIKSITEKVYRKGDFTGVIRIDYMVLDSKIYLNEINSVPGSLAYYLFCDSVKEFSNMLTELLNEGIKKQILKNNRNYNFNSNILTDIKGVKGAKTR